MKYKRLTERHLPLVDAFHCVESDNDLASFNAAERRRIKKHSKEMENFLREEAFVEQECGMNTTYLLLDDNSEKILAYISLCNDAISLEVQEREADKISYSSAPALKIARLAVDVSAMRRGIGRSLVGFAAYQAQLIREYSGVFFITLDCYAHRVSFYESLGFVRNLIQPVVLPYDSPISMRLRLDSYLHSVEQENT